VPSVRAAAVRPGRARPLGHETDRAGLSSGTDPWVRPRSIKEDVLRDEVIAIRLDSDPGQPMGTFFGETTEDAALAAVAAGSRSRVRRPCARRCKAPVRMRRTYALGRSFPSRAATPAAFSSQLDAGRPHSADSGALGRREASVRTRLRGGPGALSGPRKNEIFGRCACDRVLGTVREANAAPRVVGQR